MGLRPRSPDAAFATGLSILFNVSDKTSACKRLSSDFISIHSTSFLSRSSSASFGEAALQPTTFPPVHLSPKWMTGPSVNLSAMYLTIVWSVTVMYAVHSHVPCSMTSSTLAKPVIAVVVVVTACCILHGGGGPTGGCGPADTSTLLTMPIQLTTGNAAFGFLLSPFFGTNLSTLPCCTIGHASSPFQCPFSLQSAQMLLIFLGSGLSSPARDDCAADPAEPLALFDGANPRVFRSSAVFCLARHPARNASCAAFGVKASSSSGSPSGPSEDSSFSSSDGFCSKYTDSASSTSS